MAIEIVDFPSYNMVIFHSYVNVCQRVDDVLLLPQRAQLTPRYLLSLRKGTNLAKVPSHHPLLC